MEVEFNLEKGDKGKSEKVIQKILEDRKSKIVPYPSTGSIFKNVIIDGLENKDEFLELVPREKIKGGKFPAAWLIESCGLKGNQIGGAKISEEHCNFIVNADVGRATSDEVLEVIKLCKQKVREKFHINLKEEIVAFLF